MRWVRFSIYLFIALMAFVPLFHYLETDSEASASLPSGFRPDLLLTRPAPMASLSRNTQLDRLIVTPYTVKANEDIWSICQRNDMKQFAATIRSSNDLDESP